MCEYVNMLEARGEVIGKIKALAGLVKDGILTLSEAAKLAGMSVEEFSERAKTISD